ncbi:hypothetical protein SARC_01708 [Sphaeroforma arctica JP610]|uniref:Peptidase S54 rhomboid domain-containing protein n=1 Tax=Sphaeroforma arctica JP610 TaxID=667725 RepID=A0A0L0GB67_9EUKA|nr:hypothetical protein SARC_01708 [Sphaeroforma arctica JP610]KNC86139.1 hypothetical protein SARC_01708 [Sphaeroforma arctica JP610]|eukprot:XP_014160041.1 hypothetical protein SARC_01708 [Sphaeroforma arctica JP610]
MPLLSGFTAPATCALLAVHLAIPPLSVVEGDEKGFWPQVAISAVEYRQYFAHYVTSQGLSHEAWLLTHFTYMLGHMTLQHLASNMVLLAANGPLVEGRLGLMGVVGLYLSSGALAVCDTSHRRTDQVRRLKATKQRFTDQLLSYLPDEVQHSLVQWLPSVVQSVPGMPTVVTAVSEYLDWHLESIATIQHEYVPLLGASAGVAGLMGFNACLFLESVFIRTYNQYRARRPLVLRSQRRRTNDATHATVPPSPYETASEERPSALAGERAQTRARAQQHTRPQPQPHSQPQYQSQLSPPTYEASAPGDGNISTDITVGGSRRRYQSVVRQSGPTRRGVPSDSYDLDMIGLTDLCIICNELATVTNLLQLQSVNVNDSVDHYAHATGVAVGALTFAVWRLYTLMSRGEV